jgi:hypothetical protein
MRRSVRSGLAVAAMTGSSWFVGQTAASGRPGQLALIGSGVEVPATVGVLALAAGLGLTALGRRRQPQEV